MLDIGMGKLGRKNTGIFDPRAKLCLMVSK